MLTSSEQQVTIPSTVKIKMFTHMKLQPKPRKTSLAHNLKRWEKEEKYVGKGIRDKQYYWFLYCYYYYYYFSYFEVVIFNCFLFYLSCVYVKSPFFELNFDPFLHLLLLLDCTFIALEYDTLFALNLFI